ncbi:MAG: cytochrome c [Alsobacter sp.]
MTRLQLPVSAALAVLMMSSFAGREAYSAADPATIVKERQDFMGSFWPSYLKELAPIAKGASTDISHVEEKAVGLAAAARKIVGLFPQGTGRDVVATTRARPEVWSDHAGFEAAAAAFVKEADKLVAVAKEGKLEPIKAQISATAQACFGCHEGPAKGGGKYRFEEK